jgi:hypothetical protein
MLLLFTKQIILPTTEIVVGEISSLTEIFCNINQVFSNHFKFQLMNGNINLISDTLMVILMGETFVFDVDTHATLADVTANQLPTWNGYSQNYHTFPSLTLTENDTDNKGICTCADLSIFINDKNDDTGIGPIGSYLIVDTTTSDNTIIASVDFIPQFTLYNGNVLKLRNITLDLL